MAKKRVGSTTTRKRASSRGSSNVPPHATIGRGAGGRRPSLLWDSVSYPVNFVYNLVSSSLAKIHDTQYSKYIASKAAYRSSSSSSTPSSSTPSSTTSDLLDATPLALASLRTPNTTSTTPSSSRERVAKNAVARGLRKRYLYSYTKSTARAVFSKRWMRQAVRWDFVGVSLSKCWGTINSRPLPVWARRPIYQMWGTLFKCNMDEVRDPLESYPTLAAFFARQLKDGARPITSVGMASPVDGRVISCGPVTGDLLEQVKGKTYSLTTFLGAKYDSLQSRNDPPSHPPSLFQCIIYLSPGDYHRIHFPADCSIHKRRHFPGTLFPVNYPFLKMIPSLFALNERVVLMGQWPEGFFSLTAVGAYNVGSISLNFDTSLKTNQITRDYTCANLEYFSWNGVGSHAYERNYREESGGQDITALKGDECGQFHFGSTVVLIFEAPDFHFDIQPGDYVQMGQKIGEIPNVEA
jgi:phosphatidylserine decarboxylase